ncbi:hypothetical protein NMY22_g14944 [Coprinellus aureogranulatus]|nr:hypothetical protein NMY22_g14944 [Coprinellus aureogranulatus]
MDLTESNIREGSPLGHLLHTNKRPSELEVASLREGIANILSKLSGAQYRTRSERKRLEDLLDQYRTGLAPIRHLPAEILGEILAIVPLSPGGDEFVDLNTKNHAINLGLVCHSWHAASSSRWARISANITATDSLAFKKMVLWFGRARKSRKALRLRLLKQERASHNECGCGSIDDQCWWMNQELLALLRETELLDSLELIGLSPACFGNLLGALERQSALKGPPNAVLRALKANWASISRWSDDRDILKNLPTSLKYLHLRLPALGVIGKESGIPAATFRNLITLHLGCPWKSTWILNALRHCTNVEDLRLTFSPASENTTWTSTYCAGDVMLPKVKRLQLTSRWPSYTSKVVSFLRMPSLSHVTIDNCLTWVDGGGRQGDLLEILQDGLHLPQLESLTVKDSVDSDTLDADSLYDALVRLPTLRDVVLDGLRFDATVWTKGQNGILATQGDSTPFLPNLRQFQVLEITSEFQLNALLQYFKAQRTQRTRSSIPDTLRRIVVHFWEWKERDRDTWGECEGIVRELWLSYGLAVDRLLSRSER